MPVRSPHERCSAESRPADACSHTREVTDILVALFYFSSGARKRTCQKRRPQTSATQGAGFLRVSRLT
jgi:hypothetical protein